jgi:hypothetical protein
MLAEALIEVIIPICIDPYIEQPLLIFTLHVSFQNLASPIRATMIVVE